MSNGHPVDWTEPPPNLPAWWDHFVIGGCAAATAFWTGAAAGAVLGLNSWKWAATGWLAPAGFIPGCWAVEEAAWRADRKRKVAEAEHAARVVVEFQPQHAADWANFGDMDFDAWLIDLTDEGDQ